MHQLRLIDARNIVQVGRAATHLCVLVCPERPCVFVSGGSCQHDSGPAEGGGCCAEGWGPGGREGQSGRQGAQVPSSRTTPGFYVPCWPHPAATPHPFCPCCCCCPCCLLQKLVVSAAMTENAAIGPRTISVSRRVGAGLMQAVTRNVPPELHYEADREVGWVGLGPERL